MIADYISLYFSMTAVGCNVVAYEFDYNSYKESCESGECNTELTEITERLMWVSVLTNIFAGISHWMRHNLYFDWRLAKRQITRFDTMRNTGEWKSVAYEIILLLPMPYPFLN